MGVNVFNTTWEVLNTATIPIQWESDWREHVSFVPRHIYVGVRFNANRRRKQIQTIDTINFSKNVIRRSWPLNKWTLANHSLSTLRHVTNGFSAARRFRPSSLWSYSQKCSSAVRWEAHNILPHLHSKPSKPTFFLHVKHRFFLRGGSFTKSDANTPADVLLHSGSGGGKCWKVGGAGTSTLSVW